MVLSLLIIFMLVSILACLWYLHVLVASGPYLITSILIVICINVISYKLFGTMCLISARFYLLGWPQPLGFSLPSLKPILFLCHCKGFCIVNYFDDILVLVHSKWADKRACSQVLDYILIFPSLTFASLRLLVSWGYFGILTACQYLYLVISELTFSS